MNLQPPTVDTKQSTIDYSIDQKEARRGIRNLVELGEPDARTFYEGLVGCATNAVNKASLLERLSPPAHIKSNERKCRAWNEAAEYFTSILAAGNGSRLIWELYECLPTQERFKVLGQYFTPRHVGRFALSGLSGLPTSILDPMAGHGVFLQEAKARYPLAHIIGVDIDYLPLAAARLILGKESSLTCDDVFAWARNQVANNSDFEFSAVAGNPAYVSYQNLSMIRNVAPNVVVNYKDQLLVALKEIARRKAVDSELASLFATWSGYSDLSTYAMILAWLLLEHGGQIAFVMSNHWMERKYGMELRRFLSSHGTIRGIVTHRAGNWFPRAQIPASVFVYTKGPIAERQKYNGIPYVEISAPATSDLGAYLNSILKGDFWQWVDRLDSPGKYGPLHVTFKRWQDSSSRGPTVTRAQTIVFPSRFPQEGCSSLTDAGWVVHQGLRTGCNEVFYVRKSHKDSDLYFAYQTLNGKKQTSELFIPAEFLVPAIRRLPSRSRLVVGIEQSDSYLLNLTNAILKEDKDSVHQEYSREWIEEWGIKSLKVIPEQLSRYLTERALTPYEGKGKTRGAVVSLSAVRTNIYRPPKKSANLPRRPRFWYQVQIQPRHHGKIIIQRVISGCPRAFLVKKPESILVDANFTTFNARPGAVDAKKMWVWFNSNAFRALCELNGVPLGGGALKLEAELLSEIPVPAAIVEMDESVFDTLNRMLETPEIDDESLLQIGRAIDDALFGTEIGAINLEVLIRLAQQRKRAGVRSDKAAWGS